MAGGQDSNPVEASPEIELYLSKGCCGDAYAQTAHDQSLLFSLSPSPCSWGHDCLLRDAHAAPLLHSKAKVRCCKTRIDVYRGESVAQESLAFTVKSSSLFSRSLHIYLAGSSPDGPPDYKLKPSAFSRSLKIFRHEDVVAKALSLKTRIDVYRGESVAQESLAFTVKSSSVFSRSLHIYLAGSSPDGPPDYKLKPSAFSRSLKIFRHEDVVAKAKKDFVLCGCFEPDYRITIGRGMDQAMAVLLVAIYDDLQLSGED